MHFGIGSNPVANQNRIDRVIGYICRTLSKTKHKYLAQYLKFLALKWAITEQFHEYPFVDTFIMHTDNNPLTYILTSVKLDATGHHSVVSLNNYYFSLRYKSGKSNIDADTLSHIPWEDHDHHIEADTVQAVISNTTHMVPPC